MQMNFIIRMVVKLMMFQISTLLLTFSITFIQAGPAIHPHRHLNKRNTQMSAYQFNWGITPNFAKTCSSNVRFNPQEFVDLHNKARLSVGAENIEWDQGISNFAQCWANRCIFEHSHKDKLGENIAAGSGPYSDSMAVQEWWEEYKDWKPGMDFTEETGHYSQMAWKSTTKVGCGVANCPSNRLGLGGTLPFARFVVCDYFPPGNVIGYFDGEVDLPRYDCFKGESQSDYDQGSSDYSNQNDDQNSGANENQDENQNEGQSDYNNPNQTTNDDSNDQKGSSSGTTNSNQNSGDQSHSFSYSYNFSYPSSGSGSTAGLGTTTGTTAGTTETTADITGSGSGENSDYQSSNSPTSQTTKNDVNQVSNKTHSRVQQKHKQKNMKKLKCKSKTKKHHRHRYKKQASD